MRVVVDANVVASALVRPEGWTATQFRRRDAAWIAPAYLVEEIDEHAAVLAAKAGCSVREFRRRFGRLTEAFEWKYARELATVLDHPLVRAAVEADADDASYVAAFVAGEGDLLWTRDKALLETFPGFAVSTLPAE